jgi:hypothetical protein
MRPSKDSSANAFWLSALFAMAAGVAATSGCRRTPPEPVREMPDASAAAAPAAAADAGGDDGAADAEAAARAAYETAAPVSGKSIGNTSLVFKLRLEGDYDVAYKPRSRKPLGTTRYKGEIAAYRLSQALGIQNVPLAIPRAFVAADVRKALAPGGGATAWDKEALPDEGGKVHGALIPWIANFEFYEGDHEPERSHWETWLTKRGSTVPETDRWLAGQISTMLLFDYVTGNWDRWSGYNIGIDRLRHVLLFVDNDGTFYESPSKANLKEQLSRIEKVERFSKSFVASLRDFDVQKFQAAVGDEEPGTPLLPEKIVQAADARRQELVQVVDAKIAADGEAAVLYFE